MIQSSSDSNKLNLSHIPFFGSKVTILSCGEDISVRSLSFPVIFHTAKSSGLGYQTPYSCVSHRLVKMLKYYVDIIWN
ncbi:unnamed protein product [Cylicocyclus nassatus]|uniref:Uncharacterized protein n=1 Tax=Cylicocyclus nassatus TaxID=53992 RepID=A0AA36MEG0_CYLNA|nr:unnamed protein product [Cylicocyclus nassatus]